MEKQSERLKEYLSTVDKESNKSAEMMKLQHISLILIFIAHATISDATKEVQSLDEQPNGDDDLLRKVFNTNLPK